MLRKSVFAQVVIWLYRLRSKEHGDENGGKYVTCMIIGIDRNKVVSKAVEKGTCFIYRKFVKAAVLGARWYSVNNSRKLDKLIISTKVEESGRLFIYQALQRKVVTV